MYCIEIHQSIVFAFIVVLLLLHTWFWVSCENHDCVNKLNHNKNTQVCMFLHELRHRIQTLHIMNMNTFRSSGFFLETICSIMA